MNKYELCVVVNANIEDDARAKVVDKCKAYVERFGGTITEVDDWGKKKLAYQIKGQDFAVYYYYELELPVTAPAKISSVLNITDEAIRYLLVAKDPRREKLAAKRQEHKAQEEKEEE